MNFSSYFAPPADAETYGTLKIKREDSLCLKIWKGKQSRPFANYRFRNEEHREKYIQEQKDNHDTIVKYKADHAAKKAEQIAEMQKKMIVGTILHYSWGYEQTNCEFYQVTERTGAMVTIRAIAGQETRGTGPMAAMCKPVRDHFVGEPMKKRITAYGVRFDFGSGSPCSDTQEFYSSWYA